jgi:hypothetical protein
MRRTQKAQGSASKTDHLPLSSDTLKRVGGSASDDWNLHLGNDVLNALWLANGDQRARNSRYAAVLAALAGIAPKDELEAMLAAQMVAAHSAAMECYRRAMIREQSFEGRRENLGQANKLSRTCTLLLDALNRYRGKGQQKVTVEHVHVNEGGQAIVGPVDTGGGGNTAKSKEQPRAPFLKHEPITQMRSTYPERDAVPIAGGEG